MVPASFTYTISDVSENFTPAAAKRFNNLIYNTIFFGIDFANRNELFFRQQTMETRVTFQKLLALTGLAAGLAIGTAQATVISGSATFADSAANPIFTGTANNADITNLNPCLSG